MQVCEIPLAVCVCVNNRCKQVCYNTSSVSAGFYKAPGKLPTSIHFAAANGLSEFCSALMNITGSREASRELNCQQDNAAGLALDNDFKELAATISKVTPSS